jgi:HD-GYP domain-containing protein (c-di-GMP phosphodiesterase class II)
LFTTSGRSGFPGLLEKPGALTLEERRQMQEHSTIGERILAHVDEYSEIATVVRHHHEQIDGQAIPMGGRRRHPLVTRRIIAVADAYNAADLGSAIPRRNAEPRRQLRLAQAVESQFDTAAVAAFEAILAGADEDYRLALHHEFRMFAQGSYEESSTGSGDPVAEVA